jgi:hypothetical protein
LFAWVANSQPGKQPGHVNMPMSTTLSSDNQNLLAGQKLEHVNEVPSCALARPVSSRLVDRLVSSWLVENRNV